MTKLIVARETQLTSVKENAANSVAKIAGGLIINSISCRMNKEKNLFLCHVKGQYTTQQILYR